MAKTLRRLYAMEDSLIAKLLDSYSAGAVPVQAVKDELAAVQNEIKNLRYGNSHLQV